MIWQNILMALESIRHAKLRSFLTMLGIIIGVSSVVTVIALGAGVKRDITSQVAGFGTNLIQVSPGKLFTTDEEGNRSGFNPSSSFGVSTLTEQDVKIIQEIEGVEAASPFMLLSGVPTSDGKTAPTAFVLATQPQMIEVITEKIAKGSFLSDQNSKEDVAVIGDNIAQALFGSNDVVGKTFTLRDRQFQIIGVTEDTAGGTINLGPQLADAVYLPFSVGKSLNHGVANIIEIDAKVSDAEQVDRVTGEIKNRLLLAHGGEEDFTVLTAEDQLEIFDEILNIMTAFVAAIASISLLVGGIGVMNIMFVSVTERTREIGIRKAIGATRRTILVQFLIEAVVISLIGGLLGIAFAMAMGMVIKATADIAPVFTANAFIVAVAISTLIGVIFGTAPAFKAARKNPIEALRYE